jgi:hypothetical protein
MRHSDVRREKAVVQVSSRVFRSPHDPQRGAQAAAVTNSGIGYWLTLWRAIGVAVYVFNIPEAGQLAGFLAVMGFVYLGIGAVLTVIHDRHMAKRTRAGRARE